MRIKPPKLTGTHTAGLCFFQIRSKIFPLLYPRRCPVCGKPAPYGAFLCVKCKTRLPYVTGAVCYSCGKPVASPEQEYCYDCRVFPKSFRAGRALFIYNEQTRSAMMDFKYKNRRCLSEFYAREIMQRHEDILRRWNLDAILPVPIHKNKQKKRGYNQAELLARDLSALSGIPYLSGFLLRCADTPPQKQFGPQERLNNLQKAFTVCPGACRLSKKLQNVLLIDDIYTTGATMESCCRILHAAGISNVYIYSVCIGVSKE